MELPRELLMDRRELLKLGATSAGAAFLARYGIRPAFATDPPAPGDSGEPMPTSPLLLRPFTDALPIPAPLAPSDPRTWKAPNGAANPPYPASYHQVYQTPAAYYRIQLLLRPHNFTSSPVQPIDALGNPVLPPDGIRGARRLPPTYVAGFNGTFPGPLIRAFYGAPACVRFENLLKFDGPGNPWGDYGVPSFLTHLHNGHTACESDGNPHDCPRGYDSWHLKGQGPSGKEWCCDNLYLNMVPDNDDSEKQSFLWFHDHRMDNTSSNVYKGMVGLYLLYDKMDNGNEATGYRLPGFKYDIPLAFYDCLFDDGITPHGGVQRNLDETPMCDGLPKPNWWGRAFFQQYTNHGFVGDVYTVNGKAWPVLRVKRRKYRLRFLDCSISRWYRFSLMRGQVVRGQDIGEQWKLAGAQQCMRMVQVASEGGLLPAPIVRDSFVIAPAKRREFVVDFTRYMDGSPTRPGDVIYVANDLEMATGRKPDESQTPGYVVPILKIIIEGDPPEPDQSLILPQLRPLPQIPPISQLLGAGSGVTHRTFVLQRGGGAWQINGRFFDPLEPMAFPRRGTGEVWTIANGGGGWVHPMHFHMEEHRVLMRNGVPAPDAGHPDDVSKEDVIALDPGETVTMYRKFRTFIGPYVAHCHNLAHEDHAMMFGWSIVP